MGAAAETGRSAPPGGFPGPEHAIEAVAELFDFKGLKAVEPIAGGAWVEAQRVGGGR